MLSRIFWVGIASLALVTGMVLQDGGRIFSWADDRADISARMEHSIDDAVDRAVDGSIEKMQVLGPDGKEISAPAESKRALADAVGRLVKAEADLAILRARDGSAEERQAVEARRAQARSVVDRLKAEIRQHDQPMLEKEAISEQVEQNIRDEIRTEIREAVRN